MPVEDNVLLAGSVTPVTVFMFRPIEPALVPVVLVAFDVTVHVADGAPPTAVTEATVGAVPPVPEVVKPNRAETTLFTGSENVTVHDSGPAFAGFVEPADR